MRKLLALLLVFSLLLPALALGEELGVIFSYDSDTLRFTISYLEYKEADCYLTRLWMADPARQIHKVTADWHRGLENPLTLGTRCLGAALCVNASGFVSPQYPEIPKNYPGTSSDYYYTPLGSLTVTDGEVVRELAGVPYYGLTLEADGLHLYNGADNAEVLAASPLQTWAFYVRSPLVVDHQSIVDENWTFARAQAPRNLVARLDDGSYVLLTAADDLNRGLNLINAVALLQEKFDPVWVFNLDGGDSTALIARRKASDKLRVIFGNVAKVTDVMVITE